MPTDKRMLLAYLLPLAGLLAVVRAACVCAPYLRIMSAAESLSEEESNRAAERAVLELGGPDRAAELALAYLRMPEALAPHKTAACRILHSAATGAVAELAAAARDPDSEIRATAAAALAGSRAELAVPVLAGMLDDLDEGVCTTASGSLVATGAAPGLPARVYEGCLKSEGWALQAEPAVHGRWMAAVLVEGDGARGFRLVLSTGAGDERRVAAEWRAHGSSAWISNPLLIDVAAGPAPELVFARTDAATKSRDLRIFNLSGEIREIPPRLSPGLRLAGLVELGSGRRHGLLVLFREFENYWWFRESPQCRRIYTWDPGLGGFADSSADHPGYYRRRIASHARELTGYPTMEGLRGEWGTRAVSQLLDYWCIGRADEGALIFSRHMRRAKRHMNTRQRRIVEEMEEDLADRLCLARG